MPLYLHRIHPVYLPSFSFIFSFIRPFDDSFICLQWFSSFLCIQDLILLNLFLFIHSIALVKQCRMSSKMSLSSSRRKPRLHLYNETSQWHSSRANPTNWLCLLGCIVSGSSLSFQWKWNSLMTPVWSVLNLVDRSFRDRSYFIVAPWWYGIFRKCCFPINFLAWNRGFISWFLFGWPLTASYVIWFRQWTSLRSWWGLVTFVTPDLNI